jgi:hypothetical protein
MLFHPLSLTFNVLATRRTGVMQAAVGVGYARMLLASGESERILCEFGDGLGCEPERLCDIGRVSRHAETIDPEGNALIADPTGPPESCGGFDGHARGDFGR